MAMAVTALIFLNYSAFALAAGPAGGVANVTSVTVDPAAFIPGSTDIVYTIDSTVPCGVYVDIVDASGRTVRHIYDGNRSSGTYTVPWDGRDNGGVRVPDGTYTVNVQIYRLDAAQPVQKISQWGNYGRTAALAYGIAVNSTGYLYVTECYYNNVVQIYAPSGAFLTQFGYYGNGNGQLNNPQGLAINATGYVYVVDRSNSRVEIYDVNGNYVAKFGSYGSGDGQFKNPYGVAINSTGYVYVTDSGNYRVEVFDANGNFVAKFGSYMADQNNPTPGEFRSLSGIAVNSTGYAYVVDNSYGQVQIFDVKGNCVNSFWATSDKEYGLRTPVGIGINSTGYVYVTDTSSDNENVVIFDANGNYLGDFGSPGSGAGQLSNPTGLAFGTAGNVYVVDQSNSRVQLFNATGSYLSLFPISVPEAIGQLYVPIGMDINATGCVYVADSGNNRIEVFDNNGNYVAKFGSYGSGNGQLSGPMDVVFNSAGYIYVADTGNNRIEVFDKDGHYVSQFGNGGGAGQLNHPAHIAFNSTGYIFVTNMNGAPKVQVFDPLGNYLAQFNGTLRSSIGVAVNSSDFVYVTDSMNNSIEVFDPRGNNVTRITGGLNRPCEVEFDAGDNAFVADKYNGIVKIYDRNGNPVAQFNDSLYYPNDVAVNSAGFVYVTNDIFDARHPGMVEFGFSVDHASGSASVRVASALPVVRFGAESFTVDEDAGTVSDVVTVRRANEVPGPFTVDYTMGAEGDSAVPDTNYAADSGTLVFSSEDWEKTIPLTIIDDHVAGPDRAFTVRLRDATNGATVGSPDEAVVTIRDAGAPEEGSFTLDLKEGWNLVSYPFAKGESINVGGLFLPLLSKVTIIWAYDPELGWLYYIPGGTDNTLTAIDDTMGVWVLMASDASITIPGTMPSEPPIAHLSEGWNLVGYPSLDSNDPYYAFYSVRNEYSVAWGFDRVNKEWQWYVPGGEDNNLEMAEPGYAYWIQMNEPGDFTIFLA